MRQTLKQYGIASLLLFSLGLMTAALWAQEGQPETAGAATEENSEATTEQNTADTEAGKESSNEENNNEESNNARTSSGDDFVPSEEISEDLSVSFPVDI